MKIKLSAIFLFMISQISMAASLCEGMRVIDRSNDTGVIVEVFSNKIAKVRFDNYGITLFSKPLDELSAAVQCKNKFCINSRVMDLSKDTGNIKEIFDNGIAKVQFDGYGSTLFNKPLAQLGKGYQCIGDACVGDRVIDRSNDTGNIKEIFDNGIAKVKFDGYGSTLFNKSLMELGYHIDCSDLISCHSTN